MSDFLQRPSLLCEHSLSFQEGGLVTNACLSLPPSHTCTCCAQMEKPLSCFQVQSAQPGHTMATETRGGHRMEARLGCHRMLPEMLCHPGAGGSWGAPGEGQCWKRSPQPIRVCSHDVCPFLLCGISAEHSFTRPHQTRKQRQKHSQEHSQRPRRKWTQGKEIDEREGTLTFRKETAELEPESDSSTQKKNRAIR